MNILKNVFIFFGLILVPAISSWWLFIPFAIGAQLAFKLTYTPLLVAFILDILYFSDYQLALPFFTLGLLFLLGLRLAVQDKIRFHAF
jgi:hypothetical protein